MAQQLPDYESIVKRLQSMSQPQIEWLARTSGVPFGTLMKIRSGATTKPRYQAIAAIYPHLMPE